MTNADPAGGGAAPKSWGAPFQRLDDRWTRIEAWLCRTVLIAQIGSIIVWISLKGLAAPAGSPAGPAYRSLVTAALCSIGASFALKKASPRVRGIGVVLGLAAGAMLGRLWVLRGSEYASNLSGFIQNASVFCLIDGLRGLFTRLTLWVALLGASLATGRGKHINIDIAVRLIPERMRVPASVLGYVAAAAVCFAGAYGFADHIFTTRSQFGAPSDIECPGQESKKPEQRARCEAPIGQKLAKVREEMAGDLFILGRQISLDLGSIPRVIRGDRYDRYLTNAEWNTWVRGADWSAHFGQGVVEKQLILPDDPQGRQLPAVVVPGHKRQGLLIRELNFIFVFGFFMIGVRFLLRSLLLLSGHASADPDAVHNMNDDAHARPNGPTESEKTLEQRAEGGVS